MAAEKFWPKSMKYIIISNVTEKTGPLGEHANENFGRCQAICKLWGFAFALRIAVNYVFEF